MRRKAASDLWWKNAVVYCVDVETFLDSDGDGTGDLVGLTERLDHLAGLGVSCLWLMPFYASPGRDDGYDIADFFQVDPRLGTAGDLVELVRSARDRGMRVIADLVVNHTSDRHPWFRSARASRDSPYRDFYVWVDERPPEEPGGVVFPDKEDSNWAWDEEAGQWYLHRFYSHQPDLNVANPQVRDEIAQIAGFWLEQGLSGFRVDAVPFLVEPTGMPEGAIEDPHDLLRDLRAYLSRRRGDAILLGEVNLPPADLRTFFGDEDGDELHMAFTFTVNQALYLALAREDAEPLRRALRELPDLPEDAAWANFARNHDELTLDKLGDAEREEVFAAFGPDPDLQLFGRGLRRRLPPMLGGDPAWIRLAYSLVFALPGTPVLFYGEEIGMGESLAIEGRMSVRSPMQWSADPHGGFTTADEPVRPLPDGAFGPEHVNVAAQRRDDGSLLAFVTRLARRRRECPELGFGTSTLLDAGAPAVLARRSDWGGSTLVLLHNLAAEPATARVEVDGAGAGAQLVDLLGPGDVDLDAGGRAAVDLEPHGHRWYRVRRAGQLLAP